MGDWAEYELERQYPEVFGSSRRRGRPTQIIKWDYPEPEKLEWTMRDGAKIRLGDMTLEHRTNCLRLLIKRHGERARDTPTGRALIKVGVLE